MRHFLERGEKKRSETMSGDKEVGGGGGGGGWVGREGGNHITNRPNRIVLNCQLCVNCTAFWTFPLIHWGTAVAKTNIHQHLRTDAMVG